MFSNVHSFVRGMSFHVICFGILILWYLLIRPKWANTLFSEIKHSFALFLKLNREMPLICNSTI